MVAGVAEVHEFEFCSAPKSTNEPNCQATMDIQCECVSDNPCSTYVYPGYLPFIHQQVEDSNARLVNPLTGSVYLFQLYLNG